MAPALKQKKGNGADMAATGGQHKCHPFKAGGNSLKHWDNMKTAVLSILRENQKTDIPPARFFKEISRSDVLAAANVYFGGINGVRADLMAEGLLPLKDSLEKPPE